MNSLSFMARPSLYLLLLQLSYIQLAGSHSTVKFLPGFEGPLPFELETGYVGVGESEVTQLFYYFVKSERNPEEAPLLLWLTGGPKCSCFSALAYEIGPIQFNVVEYNGSLPTLVSNPHSWTKVANILFVDSPVGTGFSYARNTKTPRSGDFEQVDYILQFFKKWIMDHSEFQSNPVYIGGDSYSGLIVPAVIRNILDGREEEEQPRINLQGYILGNAVTEPNLEENSKIQFAHGMGLISDELYESLKRSCGGQYQVIDPNNVACLRTIKEYSKTYGYLLSYYWMNDGRRTKALHIREGSVGEWKRCGDKSTYKQEIGTGFPYHRGDHDMLVPFVGTQAWIRNLNYSIVKDWRPWRIHGQIAGYTRSYSNQMTYATIKGGGHTAPEYRPAECYAMFERWILHEPL